MTDATPEGRTWQPIETAPKDGTKIIGWTPPDPGADNQKGYVNVLRWSELGEWWTDTGFFDWKPTKWQPFPEPPSE